jgi:hypothetical protein
MTGNAALGNRGTLPCEKTNVDQGKESDRQSRTDNQYSQRRSIEKPARASTGVSTIAPPSLCMKLLQGRTLIFRS